MFVFVCLITSMYFNGIGNVSSFETFYIDLWVSRWWYMKSPLMLQWSSLLTSTLFSSSSICSPSFYAIGFPEPVVQVEDGPSTWCVLPHRKRNKVSSPGLLDAQISLHGLLSPENSAGLHNPQWVDLLTIHSSVVVDKSGIDHPTFLAELIEFIVVFRSDGFVAYLCSERDWSIGLSSKSVLVRFHAIGHFVQHVPQVARTFRRTVTLFFWETALNRGSETERLFFDVSEARVHPELSKLNDSFSMWVRPGYILSCQNWTTLFRCEWGQGTSKKVTKPLLCKKKWQNPFCAKKVTKPLLCKKMWQNPFCAKKCDKTPSVQKNVTKPLLWKKCDKTPSMKKIVTKPLLWKKCDKTPSVKKMWQNPFCEKNVTRPFCKKMWQDPSAKKCDKTLLKNDKTLQKQNHFQKKKKNNTFFYL